MRHRLLGLGEARAVTLRMLLSGIFSCGAAMGTAGARCGAGIAAACGAGTAAGAAPCMASMSARTMRPFGRSARAHLAQIDAGLLRDAAGER